MSAAVATCFRPASPVNRTQCSRPRGQKWLESGDRRMTDEDKKKIVSEPPPPTDEIDGEWGDDDETLVRDAPSLSDPPKVSVRPSAPASSPPAASPGVKPQAAAP